MKFAVIARPPVLGGKHTKFDAEAAKKVPGVEAVIELEGVYAVPRKFGILGGIAVIANSTYAAMQGRDALNVEWDSGPNKDYDSVAYDKPNGIDHDQQHSVAETSTAGDGVPKSSLRSQYGPPQA